jgi:Bacterial cell division membrane protein
VSVGGISLQRAASPLHDKPTFRRLDLVDPYLLIATLLLMAYGLVITYSTSYEDVAAGDPVQFIIRGAIFTVLGIVTMAAVAYFDYAWFGTFAPVLYLVTLGLLVLVLVIGHNVLGGQRWITIAGQKFQVSEFAKIFMIVVLAKYFADRHDRMGSPLVLGGALEIGRASCRERV